MTTAKRSAIHLLLSGTTFLFVFLSAFWPSGTEASTPALLDYSWQLVLEYASRHGFAFGRDIIFTYGPLGFLDSEVSQGHLIPFRIVFATVWAGVVACTTLHLTTQLPPVIRWYFIVWTGIFSTLGGLELHIYQVFGYCAWQILLGSRRRVTVIFFCLICFAFLSLVKFVMLLAAVTTVGICAIVKLVERKHRDAALLLGGYVLFLAIGWMAAGQKISLFLPWLQGSVEIARGYSLAMSYRYNSPVVNFCLAAAAGMFIALMLSASSSFFRSAKIGFIACLSCYGFLCWKHVIIRPDPEHIYWLFVPLPLLACYLWLLPLDFFPAGAKRRVAAGSLCLTIVSCLLGMEIGSKGIIGQRFAGLPKYLLVQVASMKDILTGQLDTVYAAEQKGARPSVPDMSTIKSIVDNKPIDVFNYQQWLAIDTGLNYRPRPVMQGYQAYTPYLAGLNDAFYHGPRAPAFVLMNMETIDNRFPTLDDSKVLTTLLHDYRPVVNENTILLLRKRSEAVPLRMEPLLQRNLRFGESVDVSPWTGQLLYLKIQIKPSLAVAARRIFYKEPLVTMRVNSGKALKEFRFVPIMGTTPFLLSPLIENNEDVRNVYAGTSTKQIRSFSLEDQSGCFSNDDESIRMVLYRVHDLS